MAKDVGAGVKIARGILYVFACIAAVVIVALILYTSYYAALNTTNINMTIKEAYAKRAQVVLLPSEDTLDDEDILGKLFTKYGMVTDEMLNGGHYDEYEITDYYENVKTEFHITWPWETKETVIATERVRDIAGRKIVREDEEEQEVSESEEEVNPPDWMNGVYEVYMVKDEATGEWRINGMKLIEAIVIEDEEEPSASPSASASASATVSPSASASQEAEESADIADPDETEPTEEETPAEE